MATVVGEVLNYNMKAGKRDRFELEMHIAIGAAGAVTTPLQSQDDPNMSATLGTTGVYALTFPPSPDSNSGTIDVTVISAAGTIKGYWCTAFSPTAGTASITTSNGAGTATAPASGDVIIVSFTFASRL